MFLEKKIFKLLEWFSNIPLDILITYPLSYLHFLKCVSFYAEYSYIFELESMINQFEIFYKDKPLNNEILFNFYYLKAICSLAKKESKYIKTNIDKMLIYIEDNNFEFMARTNLMLGYYYDLEYDLNNSIYCYKLASKYFYNNNEYERYIECFYHIGTSLLEHGKLRDAKLILLEIIKNEPLNNKNILLYQNLYEIHYHLNEIDSLNIIISNILKLKGSLNFLQLFIVLYCSIYYNILLSSFDKVDAYIIQLNQLLNNGKFIEEENVYILITLKYIKLRELDKCKEFVDKYIYITSLDSFKTLKPGILTLFIESLILLNKLSDAEIIINKSLIESQKLTTEQITIYLLKAFLHYNQNNLNESKASIYKALKIGEKEGFIRLFTDSHKEIRHLILEVLNSKISISKKYINSIKKSFYAEDKNLLSSREIEILKFICDGLSNKQISDKLYISLNTVKAHIAHIFKKLNIERRTQATQKLKELNL
ncbi:MAG: LuxR C-terminal-related transcriptional regulator [Candidatus Sericytochromatia bacterium]